MASICGAIALGAGAIKYAQNGVRLYKILTHIKQIPTTTTCGAAFLDARPDDVIAVVMSRERLIDTSGGIIPNITIDTTRLMQGIIGLLENAHDTHHNIQILRGIETIVPRDHLEDDTTGLIDARCLSYPNDVAKIKYATARDGNAYEINLAPGNVVPSNFYFGYKKYEAVMEQFKRGYTPHGTIFILVGTILLHI